MNNIDEIILQDCPACGGTGVIEAESDWCVYVVCADCGARTAEISFSDEESKYRAALISAELWDMGKVISHNPGE